MFFGNAVPGLNQLFGLFSTHPPLVERIRRIDPSFDGDFSKVRLDPPVDDGGAERIAPRRAAIRTIPLSASRAVAAIGTLDAEHVRYASDLKASIPAPLTDVVREPLGAQGLVFALFLDPNENVRRSQLAWLDRYVLPAAVRETRRILSEADRLAPEAKLPLVALAAPALCEMTRAQFHDFVVAVKTLVEADQKTSLFEYALQRLLMRHVVAHFVGAQSPGVRHHTAAPLVAPTATVLSCSAWAGQDSPADAARAFEAGVSALGWPGARFELAPQSAVDIRAVDASLDTLNLAAPMLKKQILQACAACISVDGFVTVEEGELLRAVSDSLGCPMPPLLDGAEGGELSRR